MARERHPVRPAQERRPVATGFMPGGEVEEAMGEEAMERRRWAMGEIGPIRFTLRSLGEGGPILR
jgi:hypothetical protein